MTSAKVVEQIRHALSVRSARPIARAELYTPASVLVPIFEKDGEIHLLFTLRTQDVKDHKGEIAFPGGRQDSDDTSAQEAALREAQEEVGIIPVDVQVLGELDQITTITQYVISPFVGAISYPYPFRINEQEIEELMEVPLKALLDPGIYSRDDRWYGGELFSIHYFRWGKYVIWGATAKILKSLLETALNWRGADHYISAPHSNGTR